MNKVEMLTMYVYEMMRVHDTRLPSWHVLDDFDKKMLVRGMWGKVLETNDGNRTQKKRQLVDFEGWRGTSYRFIPTSIRQLLQLHCNVLYIPFFACEPIAKSLDVLL